MKHILLSIFGVTALLCTQSALAQCPSSAVEDLLELTPVSSHYTARVLQRADEGLAFANTAETAPYSDSYFYHWGSRATKAVLRLVDTNLRVTEEQQGLIDRTACLHTDLLILEAKMEEVRCELNSAFEEISIGKILRLEALLRWLNERYRILLEGALDPTVEDASWHRKRIFDDPDLIWCSVMYGVNEEDNYTCKHVAEEQCWEIGGAATFLSENKCWESIAGIPNPPIPEPGDPMCPFHSDYLPPTVAGFGCDSSVMLDRRSISSVEEEDDALRSLIGERDQFLHELGISTDEPEHQRFIGCFDALSNVPIGQREAVVPLITRGAIRHERRGPFSFGVDNVRILQYFLPYRMRFGRLRQQADFLKLPNEFANETDQNNAAEEEKNVNMFSWAIRQSARTYMFNWNIESAGLESMTAGKLSDAPLQMNNLYSNIRAANKEIAELSSAKGRGARKFAAGTAWFIRRSCIFRPCNEKLETVLRIILQDSCFPYATGRFVGNRNVHETCRNAAEL